jgi:hypothetical protein
LEHRKEKKWYEESETGRTLVATCDTWDRASRICESEQNVSVVAERQREGKVSTCCGDGSGEGNAEGYYKQSLARASTTSFSVVSELETHEKGRQHSCKQDSILVPEYIYSEDEKTWMNQIRNAHFYGRTKCTLGENG